jgi:hypothetical protein
MVIYCRARSVSVNFAVTHLLFVTFPSRPTPSVRDADAFFAARRAMCCSVRSARKNNSPALNWKTNLFASKYIEKKEIQMQIYLGLN